MHDWGNQYIYLQGGGGSAEDVTWLPMVVRTKFSPIRGTTCILITDPYYGSRTELLRLITTIYAFQECNVVFN